MSTFNGTFEEFKTYLNDYVKNKVPALTRKHKNGICELCGKATTLHAAHIRGREREIIIKEAFNMSSLGEEKSIFTINLETFAHRIKELHSNPNAFHFICSDCHKEYDRSNSTIKEIDFIYKNTIPKEKKHMSTVSLPIANISFEDYLRYKKYNGKKNYVEGTIKKYASNVPNYIQKHEQIDILKATSPHIIRQLLSKLNKEDYFINDNANGNKIYSNGLERYAEYLEWRK